MDKRENEAVAGREGGVRQIFSKVEEKTVDAPGEKGQNQGEGERSKHCWSDVPT